ncbi:MAG: DUF444 family protein [Desulfuromonadales bacterium]|nr:DUF444 family protein [Desulfuromonadales bacterium]
MQNKLTKYLDELRAAGISPEREARIRDELATVEQGHDLSPEGGPTQSDRNVFDEGDSWIVQQSVPLHINAAVLAKSLDELLERDRQRQEDGFPRKIHVGKLVKPGKGNTGKVVVVPTTVEEKLIHDPTIRPSGEGGGSAGTGGSGEGEEGEVIGEQPVRGEAGEGGGTGPGQGEGENHELESTAYDLGKTLSEKFQLPNLKDKGKKRSFTRYTYDLTDKNRGFGQVLDKKATLRKIVETNIALGNLPDVSDIDPTRFLIAPHDKIYRVLSPEKDFEPQAMLFFLRDYSGSMAGKATELVVSQHVLIYSWLLYQYAGQAETRFILHDTEAKEVPDFYTYYNSRVAGGTQVSTAYKLVNDIVEKENLVKDYNIYVFHGTDGDDWDDGGLKLIGEIRHMLGYASRVGVTIAAHTGQDGVMTSVARFLNTSGLLKSKKELIRMDIIQEDAEEPRLIEGIRKLIS